MPSHRNQSFSKRVERRRINRRTDHDARLAVGVQDVGAQQTSNSSAQKIKPPPLPNGSAHVNVKAGMSDEDWEKAYKETGRPKFSKKSVSKSNGNVERIGRNGHEKILLVIALLAGLAQMTLPGTAHAQATTAHTLILYDNPANDPFSKLGLMYSIMLRNLLGHFNTTVDLVPIQNTRPAWSGITTRRSISATTTTRFRPRS